MCGPIGSAISLDLPRTSDAPIIQIERGSAIKCAPPEFDVKHQGPSHFQLSLPGQLVCDIDLDSGDLVVRAAEGLDDEVLAGLIADHVLPRIAGESMCCLHASAVVLEGRAYVFVGPSGAGKSTLAVRLACSAGAELLGDDCAAIKAGRALPTHRAGRVWPGSLPLLGLPDLPADASGKVRLDDRHGVVLATRSAPVAAILLLGERARTLGLAEALPRFASQFFHLGGSPQVILDRALSLLEDHGPIQEIDRERCSREVLL